MYNLKIIKKRFIRITLILKTYIYKFITHRLHTNTVWIPHCTAWNTHPRRPLDDWTEHDKGFLGRKEIETEHEQLGILFCLKNVIHTLVINIMPNLLPTIIYIIILLIY